MDLSWTLNLPKTHRRSIIGLLIAICIIIFLFDAFLFPIAPDSIQPGLSGYARAIASAIIVLLALFVLVRSFIPNTQNTLEIREIHPKNITSEFENLLSDTLRWRYTGNFGRYLRGKVLPTLADRPNMQISVSIINPQDEVLCERHAEYRNGISSIDRGRRYDTDTVALEVIVTIIHCAWYAANKNVSIELFLLSMFDPLRIDSNDNAMILTVEDRRRPALIITSGHFMYDHFDLQMRFERQQGRKLDLGGFPDCATIAAIEADHVETFLASKHMKDLCDRLTVGRIVTACREAKNPYED